MSEIRSDVTVIGGGVAGLWSAAELMDRGLHVNLVERAPSLAAGATTRNEGWLHAGTYHAIAIEDPTDARTVTERTRFGRAGIVSRIPEAIEHDPTYAFAADEALAHKAVERWEEFGVPYREVSPATFEAEGFDTNMIRAAFKVEDMSFNSRIICNTLAKSIVERGGRIFRSTDFQPETETTARLTTKTGEAYTVRSDCFVVAAGTGTKAIFEGITGEAFPMRFFKSHLAVTPRLTEDNYFFLDPLEAGIMNHGTTTIVGINREAVQLEAPDYEVIPQTAKLVTNALYRMLPRASAYAEEVLPVACVKADVAQTDIHQDPRIVLQDLNINVFEPASGYVCALPGKMTEAPYLAKVVADHVMAKELRDPVGAIEREIIDDGPHHVTLRPADIYHATRIIEGPEADTVS